MDQETFLNIVFSRMPEAFYMAENCSLEELLMLKEDAKRMQACGWELNDVVSYMKCLVYASPNLEEDIALERMAKLQSKYK